jgi:hypothetical protein
VGPPPRGFTVHRAYPRLCATCATRPPRRPPAATCRRDQPAPAAVKGEGRRRFDFSRSRRRARPLIFSCTTALGRSETEQGITAPCPCHRCRQGQCRRGAKPAVPAERATFPSAPIASPTTRGPLRAAGCRTRSAAAATGHLHAAGARRHRLRSNLRQESAKREPPNIPRPAAGQVRCSPAGDSAAGEASPPKDYIAAICFSPGRFS